MNTYTYDQAVDILVSEGHSVEDATTVADMIVDAGLDIQPQPDDGTVYSKDELDVMREQLAATDSELATFVDDDEVGSAYPDGTASFTGKVTDADGNVEEITLDVADLLDEVTEAQLEEALAEAGWVTVGKWVGQPTKRSVKVRRA